MFILPLFTFYRDAHALYTSERTVHWVQKHSDAQMHSNLPGYKCYCQETDTPRHRLLECEKFSEERNAFLTAIRKRNINMNQLASMAKNQNSSLIQFMLAIQNKHFNMEKKNSATSKDVNNKQRTNGAERLMRYRRIVREAGTRRLTPHCDHSYAKPPDFSGGPQNQSNQAMDEIVLIEPAPQPIPSLAELTSMRRGPAQRPDSDPPDPP